MSDKTISDLGTVYTILSDINNNRHYFNTSYKI